jgi:GTP-sensing pleiotropic transcriptional regulator CodY
MYLPNYVYVTLVTIVILTDINAVLIGLEVSRTKKYNSEKYKFSLTIFKMALMSTVLYNLFLAGLIINHLAFNMQDCF